MTSLQPHASTDSAQTISGDFYLLSLLNDSVQAYPEALDEAILSLLEEEKRELSGRMSAHPDWGYLSDKAEVSLTEDGIKYAVNDEIAVDLEYGNPQTNIVATGLLRSVAKRRSFGLVSRFMEKISKGLPRA